MKHVIAGIVGCVLSFSNDAMAAPAYQAPCIQPLANPKSHDLVHYKDLENHVPRANSEADGVVRFLPITSGKSKGVNIDFYYIDFKPAGRMLAAVFKDLRLQFARFADDGGNPSETAFGPYRSARGANNPVLKANDAKWKKDVPDGALMSFTLGTPFATAFLSFQGDIQAGAPRIGEKAGVVQVTCARLTNFIFATVEAKVGGVHPVAGYRGFGITDLGNGTFRFYTKAMDRESDSLLNVITPKIFCKGHAFWIIFFENVRSYLSEIKMKPSEPVMTNHGPVPYGSGPGEQPVTVC